MPTVSQSRKGLFGGYTLIELLMVMTVLGVLAGLVLTTYPASQKRARDTRRRSDLKQYQTALETYANRSNGLYPPQATARASTVLCAALSLSGCPEVPTGTNYYYYNSTTTAYTLWVQLELPQSPVTYYVVCSNGKSGTATSGVPPSAGTCPLP